MTEQHTPPAPIIHCPVTTVPTPDLDGFSPLLERLVADKPVSGDEYFPHGVLRADGRLDLCKQDTGIVGCRAVTQALRENSTVQSLLLGTNGIGDEGAAQVADLLRHRPLRTVYLGCNLIGAPGAQALADAVRVQPGVRALWLKRNPLGLDGAHALAALLRASTTLRTLDLVHTGIGDEGARAVLESLVTGNRTLQYLYLSGNALTPAILPELIAVLWHAPALRGLYLSVNRLGDDGAQAVAAALGDNRTLDTLGLASNGLTDAGVSALLRGAARHTQLRFLDLGIAPSTRVLGAEPNRAGALTRQALLEWGDVIRGRPEPLRVLNLPPLADPEALLTALPLALTVRIAGHASSGVRAELPAHPDAADVRSLYR